MDSKFIWDSFFSEEKVFDNVDGGWTDRHPSH